MYYDEFEKQRQKQLNKFWWLVIIATAIILGVLYAIASNFETIIDFPEEYKVIGIIILLLIFFISIGIFVYAKITTKIFENKIKSHFMENILKEIVKNDGEVNWSHSNYPSNLIVEIFHSFIPTDDIFHGTYKGTDFTSAEAHDYSSKHHSPIFNGTLIEIKLNNKYDNEILIRRKTVLNNDDWYNNITTGLKKLKIKLPTNQEYEVFAENQNIAEIVNKTFTDFINNIKGNCSFLIKDDNLYVIKVHQKDKYKFGSLFKRLDDEGQREKLANDIREILYIVECAGKMEL